jgi:hypothetical protein
MRSGAPLIRDRQNPVHDDPGSAAHHSCTCAALRPGHESRLACHKNDLTRVTRIFQKRVFTKTAHDARAGTAAGFFVGSVRPDALERCSRAALRLCQPQCFVVFHCYFLPVFARDHRRRLCAHTPSGCGSGAKALWARKKLMVPRRGLRSRTRETHRCGWAVSLFSDCYLQ